MKQAACDMFSSFLCEGCGGGAQILKIYTGTPRIKAFNLFYRESAQGHHRIVKKTMENICLHHFLSCKTFKQKLLICFTGSQPREIPKTTGRLNNGIPQVPNRRSPSDLEGFRATLPVYDMQREILIAIGANRVLLICGETGSGKTTQVGNS